MLLFRKTDFSPLFLKSLKIRVLSMVLVLMPIGETHWLKFVFIQKMSLEKLNVWASRTIHKIRAKRSTSMRLLKSSNREPSKLIGKEDTRIFEDLSCMQVL